MNWPFFAILTFLLLVLERGLHLLLAVGGDGAGTGVSPSLLLILLVYVGMFAPPMTLAWAAIVLGVMLDLVMPHTVEPPVVELTLIGPHALGFLAGAYVLMQLRTMIFRGSPFTMAIVVFIIGIFTTLVSVLILQMRSWMTEPIINFSATEELVQGFLQLIYTAVAALPVGFVLSKCTPLFGFATSKR